RRTIQREIEDALSEKILFDEIGAGQLITVDVDNWDGEAANIEDAVFTFVGNKRVSADAEADPALAGAPGAAGATATATE
ncbi:MAG: ATP-dependent Clp protease ATP-binding subunit ClpC, partial [Mycobacterium sp.]|nr:ATP-dependent Clp protease ATP-binding subunit ClpC [Mycobacterium sp.]